MLAAPQLLPRAQEFSRHTPTRRRRWLYAGPLARAGDQFTWSVIMRKAQGSDLDGLRLVACGSSPENLPPWPPLLKTQPAKPPPVCVARPANSPMRKTAGGLLPASAPWSNGVN
jgi:hypothetical protein